MNKLYGPYDQDDWDTMLMLRESINGMRDRDRTKYAVPIEKESKILKHYIYK